MSGWGSIVMKSGTRIRISAPVVVKECLPVEAIPICFQPKANIEILLGTDEMVEL